MLFDRKGSEEITRSEQEALTEQYYYLIHKTMKVMNIPKGLRDDYHGCASEGLWKAVLDYDPEKGEFKHLAIKYIRNRINNERKSILNSKKNNYIELPLHKESVKQEIEKSVSNNFENNSINIYDLRNKICILNNEDKNILLLKYDGFSNKEIGQRLYMSEGTIRWRLKKIKNILSEENLATSKQISKTMAN